MTAPATHTQPQQTITERDARLTPTDRQRKKVQRQKVWWQYSQGEVSPLGGDHPALFLHRRAQAEANRCAFAVLDNDLTVSDLYKQAQAVRDTDPLQAKALLQQARGMSEQSESLQKAYETASQAHLATMVHVLAVAVAHKAQQVAVRKVAEVLYAVNVITGADTPTQAPPEKQTFTHADKAPQVASNDASTAPPLGVQKRTLDQTATMRTKGVVLTP
jgi:hypothetical protein